MNSCSFIGRITADPELKTTPAGKSVCSFTLAVKRPFTKDQTDFIPFTAWDKKAEVITQHVKKGQQIGVTGPLLSRKYEKDGKKFTAYEINVTDFFFCGGGEAKTEAPIAKKPNYEEIPDDDDLPF